jgi:hypothetical protein
LIPAGGSGIFSGKDPAQILYFDIWESDVEGRIKKLKEQGIGIDAQYVLPVINRLRQSSPLLITWACAWNT